MASVRKLIVATRRSPLAMVQTQQVCDYLKSLLPDTEFEILGLTTSGDLWKGGWGTVTLKGLFVKELQEALLDGRADMAVHSVKDLPFELPDKTCLAAVLERKTPWDAFVGKKSMTALPAGSRVGTSSLRRKSQLVRLYPNLEIVELRGNIDTRLRKVAHGEFDGIVVAEAALQRLRFKGYEQLPLIPAVGQGVIGLEVLKDHEDVRQLLQKVNHRETEIAIMAERAFLGAFQSLLMLNCRVPIGCVAEIRGRELHLRGYVGSPDGIHGVEKVVSGRVEMAAELGVALGNVFLDLGASSWIVQ